MGRSRSLLEKGRCWAVVCYEETEGSTGVSVMGITIRSGITIGKFWITDKVILNLLRVEFCHPNTI